MTLAIITDPNPQVFHDPRVLPNHMDLDPARKPKIRVQVSIKLTILPSDEIFLVVLKCKNL
ncbi:unnamed protein product [Arabidopsis halleri]